MSPNGLCLSSHLLTIWQLFTPKSNVIIDRYISIYIMKRVYENKFEKLYRCYYSVTLRISFMILSKLCCSILAGTWWLVNQENDSAAQRNDFPHRICQCENKFWHEMTMFQIWNEVPLGGLEKLAEKMNQSPQSCWAALYRILRVTSEWIHRGAGQDMEKSNIRF